MARAQQDGQQFGIGQCARTQAQQLLPGAQGWGQALEGHLRLLESTDSVQRPAPWVSFSCFLVNLICEGSFLTLHYRLLGPSGDALVSTFEGSPATLTLGTGALAPAMESRLLGLAEGARTGFDLAPGEAFGERNPELLQKVKLTLLRELGDPDAYYSVGDVVQFPTPDGQGSYAGVVREAGGQGGDAWLLFDFNHPLAGQAVRFEVHVIGVL